MHLKYTEENKMPSKSKKQHNLMEAVAHNKAFAKKVGIPQSVGKDFSEADKGRSFKQGGVNMKKKSVNPAMAMMMGRAMKRPALAFRPEAPVTPRPAAPVMPAVNPMAAMSAGAQGMPMMKKGGKLKSVETNKNPGLSKLPTEVRNKMGYMKKGGMSKMHKMPDGKMMKDSDMKKMNMGGMSYKEGGKAKGCATKSDAKMIAKKEVKGHESSMHKMNSGGMSKMAKGGCYASGGKASQLSKANGIAVRGKTKGKMC